MSAGVNFRLYCFNGATSSRTWKQLHPAKKRFAVFASMEPRPHERGNERAKCAARFHQLLQWSHVLTNVETSSAWAARAANNSLQWSHVLTNVETRGRKITLAASSGFNGATSSRTWKQLIQRLKRTQLRRFNGATSSRTWKHEQWKQ